MALLGAGRLAFLDRMRPMPGKLPDGLEGGAAGGPKGLGAKLNDYERISRQRHLIVSPPGFAMQLAKSIKNLIATLGVIFQMRVRFLQVLEDRDGGIAYPIHGQGLDRGVDDDRRVTVESLRFALRIVK